MSPGVGDQVMAGLQVNNHDQEIKFWTSSQFEEPGPKSDLQLISETALWTDSYWASILGITLS
jgi:hypothetical protein